VNLRPARAKAQFDSRLGGREQGGKEIRPLVEYAHDLRMDLPCLITWHDAWPTFDRDIETADTLGLEGSDRPATVNVRAKAVVQSGQTRSAKEVGCWM
jgi:hypothetical protein